MRRSRGPLPCGPRLRAAAEAQDLLEAAPPVADVVGEPLGREPGEQAELAGVDEVGLALGVAQVHGERERDVPRQLALDDEAGAGVRLEDQHWPHGEAADAERLAERLEDAGAVVAGEAGGDGLPAEGPVPGAATLPDCASRSSGLDPRSWVMVGSWREEVVARSIFGSFTG